MYLVALAWKNLNFGLCRLCSTHFHIDPYKLTPVLKLFAFFLFYCIAVAFKDIQDCSEIN